MTPLELAKTVAEAAHGAIGQKYGEKDYFSHLEHVHKILVECFVTKEEILVAGWLHDVVEDTKLDHKFIAKNFGDVVADIVHCVTFKEGRSRKEKWLLNASKLVGNHDATIVKLADRISHYESGLSRAEGKLDMYVKEYPMFRGTLVTAEHQCDRCETALWDRLNSLHNTAIHHLYGVK